MTVTVTVSRCIYSDRNDPSLLLLLKPLPCPRQLFGRKCPKSLLSVDSTLHGKLSRHGHGHGRFIKTSTRDDRRLIGLNKTVPHSHCPCPHFSINYSIQVCGYAQEKIFEYLYLRLNKFFPQAFPYHSGSRTENQHREFTKHDNKA